MRRILTGAAGVSPLLGPVDAPQRSDADVEP
jgi:hypothetical protein